MKTHRLQKQIITSAALILFGFASTLSAQSLIYSDNFARTGELDGSSPTVGELAPAWAQGATWLAAETLTTNNGKVVAPAGPESAGAYSINAYLPANISVASGIYQIDITLAASWWGPSNSWVAVGFAISTTGVDGSAFFTNSVGMVTYSRGNDKWSGPTGISVYGSQANNIGGIAAVNKAGATPLKISIVLNTYSETDNYTVTVLNASTDNGDPAVRSFTGTLTEGQINSINALKIGAYQGQPGSFADFQFTVTTTPIPEPATMGILVGTAILLGLLGCRRNTR